MNVLYDFRKHFNYIRERLGNNIYYDEDTLAISYKLFMRYCKDGNSAQISKLTNGRFRVILCQNKMGEIIHATFREFEKCIDFLDKNCFARSLSSLNKIYRNSKLPKMIYSEV